MPTRPPFRNNARLVLLCTVLAVALLLGVQVLVRKSRDFSPDFLASVLLYGLTVLNIGLLVVLVLVLGRNLVRMVMERRRKVLGARLRMRLLLVFLLMAVGPSVLLVLVGSDLIRQTVDRWFSVDVERILTSSQAIGVGLRQSVAERSRLHAGFLARELQARGLLSTPGQVGLRRTVELRARELGMDLVNVFGPEGELLAVMDPRLPPPPFAGASSEPMAEAALQGREVETTVPVPEGELMRAAVPVRDASGAVRGAVIVSTLLPGTAAAEAREVHDHYTKFIKAKASREPIKALYLSLLLLPALVALFGAVWLALYLSRRITTPLRLVAEGAERIAAGERGVRVDFPAGDEEFTALIASFNRMSERLARSEEEVERGRAFLTRQNEELDQRRQLMETVLETVGAGVAVVDAGGTVTAVNAAACRLLDLQAGAVAGHRVEEALAGAGRSEIVTMLRRVQEGGVRQQREITLPGPGRDRYLSATVAPLAAPGAAPAGVVLVVDDLTPLMRAQKVAAWGEVARKLAHEVKNPLTPIQLSAQRVRKAYLKGAPDFERVVMESTQSIVDEVEALKNLVDEFAQFARLPAPNLEPGSLHEVIDQALSLYDGLFGSVHIDRRFAPDLPAVRLDADQMKRVLINLVDNAIEATEKQGRVTISTEFDPGQGRVRLGVADDGPGIPPDVREKLFVPHFSTKKRGSGLGLAIVSRIVQDHQGTIRVEENPPHGSIFVVELPA